MDLVLWRDSVNLLGQFMSGNISENDSAAPVFCPICGGHAAARYLHPANNFVACNDCGLTGPTRGSRLEAVRIWNTRYLCSKIDQLLRR